MLKHRLIHPDILQALGSAGHGSRILIADGNYPAITRAGENASIVYLNLAPGIPTVTQVLEILLTSVPVEEATVMEPEDGSEPPVFGEYKRILARVELNSLGRYEFYEEASAPDTCLQIVTGDQRLFANLLLTIGVVAS